VRSGSVWADGIAGQAQRFARGLRVPRLVAHAAGAAVTAAPAAHSPQPRRRCVFPASASPLHGSRLNPPPPIHTFGSRRQTAGIVKEDTMTITRYNPWNLHGGLPAEFRELIEKFFGSDPNQDQSNVVTSQWMPHVDIKEEPQRFVILADIPGVDPKEIEIHMDKGILTIKGERTHESKEENEKYTRMERARGVFYRRFALPDSADADGITATGEHGVLKIVIPKRPESTPRRITINA
jgi:HSP20 family protein